MKREEADAKFWEADGLYRAGEFQAALDLLVELDTEFPNNHRLLYARARTLGKLLRTEEAIAVCDRLVNEFEYERAARLRDRLRARIQAERAMTRTPYAEVDEDEAEETEQPSRRFRIKPTRLLLLIAIVALMATGRLPYWLGGGLIIAYFGMRLALNAALLRLFSIPFRMKGKALAGATVQIHGVTPAPSPTLAVEEVDDDEPQRLDLIYYFVDVTITPPARSQGFVHWEPGELALAPAATKIRSLHDLDNCFSVSGVKFVENGTIRDDEGEKVVGPMRLKLYVGVPAGETTFKFVYYTEAFGSVEMTD